MWKLTEEQLAVARFPGEKSIELALEALGYAPDQLHVFIYNGIVGYISIWTWGFLARTAWQVFEIRVAKSMRRNSPQQY